MRCSRSDILTAEYSDLYSETSAISAAAGAYNFIKPNVSIPTNSLGNVDVWPLRGSSSTGQTEPVTYATPALKVLGLPRLRPWE